MRIPVIIVSMVNTCPIPWWKGGAPAQSKWFVGLSKFSGTLMTFGNSRRPLELPDYSEMMSSARNRRNALGTPKRAIYETEPPSSPNESLERLKSHCIRWTILFTASPALFRSALPNLIPLIAQFASASELRFVHSTITPTKGSQSGSAFLTAFVIAACISSREIARAGLRHAVLWLARS